MYGQSKANGFPSSSINKHFGNSISKKRYSLNNSESWVNDMYTGQFLKQIQYVHVPFVLACLDGLLGSPVPMELLARTRNSYSTQGLRSITVAVSRVPRTTSGTGRKHTVPSSVSTHECVWLCVLGVSQLSISSMLSSRLTDMVVTQHTSNTTRIRI